MAETYTQYYGWTKPEVGASVDAWGDMWNANLDAIDALANSIQVNAVGDAPKDGYSYWRCNGAWVSVIDCGTF